jgi:hypothetical protein
MKITKTRLQEIIREEIYKLFEGGKGKLNKKGLDYYSTTKDPWDGPQTSKGRAMAKRAASKGERRQAKKDIEDREKEELDEESSDTKKKTKVKTTGCYDCRGTGQNCETCGTLKKKAKRNTD